MVVCRRMRSWVFGLTGLMLAGAQTPALAWWDHGHELTAKIAEDILTSTSLQKAKDLLAYPLAAPGSVELSQRTNQMTTAGAWADHIKQPLFRSNQHLDPYGEPCHFIDELVFTDEIETLRNDPQSVFQRMVNAEKSGGKNALSCTKKFIRVLHKPATNAAEREAQVVAFRYLIHVVGDLHQPLHTLSVAAPVAQGQTPVSNAGASKTKIHAIQIPVFTGRASHTEEDTRVTTLHALWDSELAVFSQIPHVTLTEQNIQRLGSQDEVDYIAKDAEQLENSSEFGDIAQKVANPNVLSLESWAAESVLVGLNVAYSGLDFTPRDFPFYTRIFNVQDYMNQGQSPNRLQLTLGGYRLGNLINAIFDPAHAQPKYVQLVNQILAGN